MQVMIQTRRSSKKYVMQKRLLAWLNMAMLGAVGQVDNLQAIVELTLEQDLQTLVAN